MIWRNLVEDYIANANQQILIRTEDFENIDIVYDLKSSQYEKIEFGGRMMLDLGVEIYILEKYQDVGELCNLIQYLSKGRCVLFLMNFLFL